MHDPHWRTVSVADIAGTDSRSIAIGPFGSSLKAEVYSASGTPVVRGQDITETKDLSDVDRVYVPESVAKRFPACIVKTGDLVFPHRGAIGRVGIIGNQEMLLSSSMMKLTVNRAIVDPAYVFYYFRGPGRDELLARASTVGTPGIGQPLTSLRGIPISFPSLSRQRTIAGVLGAIDDKIASNRQIIDIADELAFAHFRAAVGRRRIPLSSLALFVNGKAFTKDATGAGRVVVRIAELNSGIGGSTVYNDIEVADDHLARPGDLLFAWSGSLTVSRWYRPEAIVNQHIFKVIPNAGVPMWLVNQAVRAKLDEFKAIAADKATTMGHIQRRHLDEPVAVPDLDDTKRIDGLMASLWDVALAAEVAALKASQTRDELLPLLMSGKIRVRDAERQVEDVL